MAPTTTMRRILSEASELTRNPSPDFHASPASDSDLFTWHFTIRGPPSTPYANGIYHGRIVLPPNYPYKPPNFRFLTPSGRFEVNRDICLSMSGHHEETWQPAWGIRTALIALRGFMESEAKGQLGGLDCSTRERERIAGQSGSWVCEMCGRKNEEIIREVEELAREREEKGGGKAVEKEVPGELRMGWKDELGKNNPAATGESVMKHEDTEDKEEEAQLAEGFVRTTVEPSDIQTSSPVQPTILEQQQQQAPLQPPAPAQNLARIQHQPQPQLAQQHQHPFPSPQNLSNDGVPIWLDRTITGVIVMLAAMILKVLLGL